MVRKQLIGHVDNALDPDIKVEIQMTLVLPAGAKNASGDDVRRTLDSRDRVSCAGVSWSRRQRVLRDRRLRRRCRIDPPSLEQLIADGWGMATVNRAASRLIIMALELTERASSV